MVPVGALVASGVSLDPGLLGGSLTGKRYVDTSGAEVLVTKAGAGH
jgi:hypothetical protein